TTSTRHPVVIVTVTASTESYTLSLHDALPIYHPNILAVYDIGTHDGSPYVVSELLEGQTLRERIDGTPMPARKAVDYAIQLARRSEEHTSELQSRENLVCRLLLEKKKTQKRIR